MQYLTAHECKPPASICCPAERIGTSASHTKTRGKAFIYNGAPREAGKLSRVHTLKKPEPISEAGENNKHSGEFQQTR
jgi:hypothetical protein